MKTRLYFAVACAVLLGHAGAQGQDATGYAPPRAYPPMASYGGGMPGPYAGPPMGMPPYAMAPGQPMPMMGPPCGDPGDCYPPMASVYKWSFFGEFLYLRPRNATVGYGTVFNGPLDTPPDAATPIQVAPIGQASIDYQPGWRAGLSMTLDECSTLGATFTQYNGDTSSTLATDQYLIRSMVSHPSSWISNAVSDFQRAEASYGIDFELGDVDYRYTFLSNSRFVLTLLAGARYANVEQNFNARYTINGEETVDSHIRFEGAGPRFGLEAERRNANLGLFVYGKSTASFVVGTARANYLQTDAFAEGPVVDTAFRADRIVTMLDLELGVGWSSPSERFRLSLGYLVSGWCNMVKTDEYILGVQRNDYVGLGDTLTFDGFVGRAEVRF